MDFVLSMLKETALVPVAVSFLVAAIVSRFSRLEAAGAVTVGCAFFAGWASQDWATLKPERYLDWLPYSALLLAIASLASVKLPNRYKCLVQAAVIFLITWLMVPAFPRLQPHRPVAIAIVAISSWVLVQAAVRLESRLTSLVLVVALMAMGTSASVIMAQSFALKFAQIAGMLSAALTAPLIFRSERMVSGLTCVFIPLLCNLLFMGFASSTSEVPWYSFALVPFAVLSALGLPQNSDDRKRRNWIIAGVLFAVVLLTAVVPALLAHPPWEEELAGIFPRFIQRT